MNVPKSQNQNRDLIASVRKLQSFGIEVQAGFIMGFDNDPESIFQNSNRILFKKVASSRPW